MIHLILLGLTFFIQLLSSVWYVMVETSKGKSAALKFKFLCSSVFVADVLLCGAIKSVHTDIYFILILTGALIAFTGDILDNALPQKNGALTIILRTPGNCVYVGAFISKLFTLFNVSPSSLLFTLFVIPVGLALVPFMCKKDGKFRIHLIASVFSSLFMTAFALYLGILCQKTGEATMQSVSCVLIVGALALCFSNLLNTRQQISPPPKFKPQLPKHCAYFFGQMLIACSVIIGG